MTLTTPDLLGLTLLGLCVVGGAMMIGSLLTRTRKLAHSMPSIDEQLMILATRLSAIEKALACLIHRTTPRKDQAPL